MSNKIFRVAKKEFLDLFRDRRTILRMVIIPSLVMPFVLYIVTTIEKSQAKKEATKELTVGYIDNGSGKDQIGVIEQLPKHTVKLYKDTVELKKAIKGEDVNVGLYFDTNFEEDLDNDRQAHIKFYFQGTEQGEMERLSIILDTLEKKELESRISKHSLPKKFEDPIMVEKRNLSSLKEMIGKYGGGILPYFFIAFCFMGCMYPAIDLFTGEKERGTMETILTSPVKRSDIMIGKMIVIVTFGIISASLAIGGLLIGVNILDIGPEFKEPLMDILSPQLLGMLALLLFPLAIFFAGLMIPLCVYSKSFKEAQSIITPLNILLVLPAIAGFLPGIELNFATSFIPIVNIVLATKDIIAENINFLHLGIAYLTLIGFAALAVFIALRQFGNESNILRGD